MNREHTRRQQQWYIARSILLCLVLLVAGFFGGMIAQRLRTDTTPSAFADLDAVYKVIEDNYYYLPTDEAGRDQMNSEMESGAIDGALDTLDDAYTRYLDADESQTSQESLQGKYGGIGIDIVLDGDVAFVSSVVPESPADRAGIQRGDVIEQVNGARVQTTDIDEATQLLRGEIGDPVTVTTIRPTTGEAQTLELTFQEIVVPQVTLSFVDGTSYAWLRITLFGDATIPDLDKAIAEIRAHGSTGVILDLRGNGGGWVDAARGTLGRFLDPSVGPALYEDQSSADSDLVAMPIDTTEGVEVLDLPMVVLIDGGTASAAEIVAGALKDYGRATVIGQNSFGKGSVQRIYEFSDGSTMRVTVAEWFTPSKSRIQSEGIRPDIEVAAGGDTDASDPVLDAAVAHLDSRLTPVATPAASPAANVNRFTPSI